MEINGSRVQMEVDIGAPLSVMSEKMFKEIGGERQSSALEPMSANLRTYTGEMIEPLGLQDFLLNMEKRKQICPYCHSWFKSSFIGAELAPRIQSRLAKVAECNRNKVKRVQNLTVY